MARNANTVILTFASSILTRRRFRARIGGQRKRPKPNIEVVVVAGEIAVDARSHRSLGTTVTEGGSTTSAISISTSKAVSRVFSAAFASR